MTIGIPPEDIYHNGNWYDRSENGPLGTSGGVGRPTMSSTGSLTNPQVGDVWSIVSPAGVEAGDFSMMQDRGAGPVALALTGVNHTVTSADIPPFGSANWPVTVRELTISLVSLPISINNPPTTPAAPAIGTAKIANSAIILAGTAPTSTGGSAITRYRGVLDDGTVAESETLPVIFYGQTAGVARTGRLQALNSLGWGALSAASNSVSPLNTLTSSYAVIPRDIGFALRSCLYDSKRTVSIVRNTSTYAIQTQVENNNNSGSNQPTGSWVDLPPNTENVITDLGKVYTRGKGFANTALSWAANVVTVVSAGHGGATGDNVRIVNAVPTGYNGPQLGITVLDANTFTYPLTTNPGVATTLGSWCGVALDGVTIHIEATK